MVCGSEGSQRTVLKCRKLVGMTRREPWSRVRKSEYLETRDREQNKGNRKLESNCENNISYLSVNTKDHIYMLEGREDSIMTWRQKQNEKSYSFPPSLQRAVNECW